MIAPEIEQHRITARQAEDHRIGELLKKRLAGPLHAAELRELSELCESRGVSITQAERALEAMGELIDLQPRVDELPAARTAAKAAQVALDVFEREMRDEEIARNLEVRARGLGNGHALDAALRDLRRELSLKHQVRLAALRQRQAETKKILDAAFRDQDRFQKAHNLVSRFVPKAVANAGGK